MVTHLTEEMKDFLEAASNSGNIELFSSEMVDSAIAAAGFDPELKHTTAGVLATDHEIVAFLTESNEANGAGDPKVYRGDEIPEGDVMVLRETPEARLFTASPVVSGQPPFFNPVLCS